jgi:hypothetical protein
MRAEEKRYNKQIKPSTILGLKCNLRIKKK